jgi:DDE superfamily endonuclease/Tc5 transposase DNA-binding domain
MTSEREIAINAALNDLFECKYPSVRSAAAAYGLPHVTLTRRYHGGLCTADAIENQQLLSSVQEDRLVQWILSLERLGHAPTHTQTREMALRISKESGGPDFIGHNWTKRFITRHPAIFTKIGKSMDSLRLKGTEKERLLAWFREYDDAIKDVNPLDIWNMDETGLYIGTAGNGRVLGSSNTKRTYIKAPGRSREWVTIIKAVSAAGFYLKPLVIFKGKSLQSSWFETDSVPDWLFVASENAFITNSIGLKWLKEIFLPQTARDPPHRRVLILDNQASHIDTEFLWQCHKNNVFLCFLIPHSSHACQPLDVCSFS